MSRQRIAIIDYGMGNLHSVASALAHVSPDADIVITEDQAVIASAERVILPGVGAIRDCIAKIRDQHIDDTVRGIIHSGRPVLGICVGMQVLLQHSEENQGVDCLGLMPGQLRRFPHELADAQGEHLKVPHIGWSQVKQTQAHPLWHQIDDNSRFYFVHSYYAAIDTGASSSAEDGLQPQYVAGSCEYGLPFAAAIGHSNLFATQFHPEKSHTDGLQLLKNFAAWDGQI